MLCPRSEGGQCHGRTPLLLWGGCAWRGWCMGWDRVCGCLLGEGALLGREGGKGWRRGFLVSEEEASSAGERGEWR